jgi:tRNA (guanine-N7-)-methyltransferase
MDRFFYIPGHYDYKAKTLPFFEKEQPIFIEYCSGNGQWISEKAQSNPQINWIAVEKKFERARLIWLNIDRHQLSNLTVVCGDGVIFSRYYAPQTSHVFINFPDPWPKLRHAKHRIIRKEFIDELTKIVEMGGSVTCTTDDEPYAQRMREEFGKHPNWQSAYDETHWPDYGPSYFKDLWRKKGRNINYLSFEKICC